MDKENPKKDGDEEGETKSFKDPAIISAISGGITAELPPDSLIEHRYTKDELLKLRKAPLAQKKPTCLDSAYYNAAGIWDPEPWHYSNKQAELAQAHENGSQGGGGGGGGDEAPIPGGKQRSRPSDPRERLRKEQDGIVLSPQRRSFNSGCFVPGREASTAITAPGVPGVAPLPLRGNRAHSPLGGVGVGVGKAGEREQPMQRRIGSGRILPWDYQEKTEENDFGYRSRDRDERGGGGRGDDRDRERGERSDRRRERTADHPEDRFERRSFGRDFESAKEVKHRQPGRFNRRVSNESREEEPEWFSSGPISQNDTIELRGFDDPPEKSLNLKKKGKRVNGDSATTTASSGKSKEIKKLASKESLIGKDGRSSPEKNGEKGEKSGDKKKDAAPVAEEEKKGAAGDMQEECFNFDAMFKADSLQIPGLLSNGIESGDSAGSRFSRWFQRERSPPTTTAQQPNESKRTSPQQEQPHHNLIRNLLGDSFNEATVAIPQPGDAESYFAPISPAANTLPTLHNKQQQQHPHQQQSSLNLIEMQQRAAAAAAAAAAAGGVSAGKKESASGGGGGAPGSGKILSLEELEAPLRQGAPDKAAQSKASEEDKQQFNRLFSQMNTNGPMMQQQTPQQQQQSKPMSIMEMLSHSQQKDAEVHHHQQHHHPRMHQRVGGSSSGVSGGGAGPPLQNMSEMAYKLQQVQNQVQRQQQLDMLSKLFAAGSFNAHQRTSPLQEMGMAQSRDLLNRPEAQAIMQGLKRGDITPQHLYQQLANPAMQPRHREMLVTILKMQPLPTQAPPSQPQAQQTQPQPPPAMVVAPQTAPPPPQQQQAQPGVGVVPPAAVSPNFYTQQLRVSPLTPNAYCVSPIMATSPNTLSVPALHQRIPSPRELQVHTQNIMQRALIKKKLEEQEENYRKKQQQAQQHQSRGAAGSPAKSTASPTLAFTPTSVMRKMNADKDDSKDGKDKIPQGRPLTGHRSAPQQSNPPVNLQQQQQQQQQQTWNHFTAQMKQPGRAIVKANNYQPGGQNAAEFFAQQQQAQQHRLMHQQQHLPQQQSQQQPQAPKNYYNQQQHQMSTGPTSGGHGTGQQYQQLSQQQLRQQHQNVRAQHQHQQQQPQAQPPQQAAQPQTFQHPPAGSWMGGSAQQAASFDANHHRGDLSPTSDQLARWFSPDLLDRARKGNVPSISNAVAQHALSLEEIERQTTTIGQH